MVDDKNNCGDGPSPELTGLILDSIAEGVFTVDPELRISSFNRAAEYITGVPASQAIGRPCSEVFNAKICCTDCPLQKSMRTGKPSLDIDVEITSLSGEVVPVRVSTAALRDNQGNFVGGVETFRDRSEVSHLVKRLTGEYTFCDLKGKSQPMRHLFAVLPQAAASKAPVLITGPSGTGKELAARAIHDLSPRNEGPFVAVNCGSLPENLIESELFGHLRGAFTGADRTRRGRFEAAEGGTLFLDEMGELPLSLQVKLLRVLDRGEYTPVGGDYTKTADVRIVAATNRNLKALMAKGLFREDLYYRLNVMEIKMPSLKERPEDIPLLVDHFLELLAAERGEPKRKIKIKAMSFLMNHSWPGNVRQLRNVIEHALIMSEGKELGPEHLPADFNDASAAGLAGLDLASQERLAIEQALARNHGNRSKAAQELGISTTTLWRRLKKYGISPP